MFLAIKKASHPSFADTVGGRQKVGDAAHGADVYNETASVWHHNFGSVDRTQEVVSVEITTEVL